MASLTKKTALVTGASRGIGRATASALANAGAHVLVHYGHSAPDAESLVAGIHAKGGTRGCDQGGSFGKDAEAERGKTHHQLKTQQQRRRDQRGQRYGLLLRSWHAVGEGAWTEGSIPRNYSRRRVLIGLYESGFDVLRWPT